MTVINEFDRRVLKAMESGDCPMASIYVLCARLGERQARSTQKFYVKVYRSCEKLVKMDKAWVARGTRDPSIYMPKSRVKGYDENGIYELPF